MYIFLISVLLVSFIGLCFFKKKFWENRYLLLMIIGGVAIIATVTTNYITRNKYPLVLETVRSVPINSFTGTNHKRFVSD
jgi:magnesium-transporting ATPase (P-type)